MADIIGYNTAVSVNDGASAAYVAWDHVTSITPPQPEVGAIESTYLASSGRNKEYLPGLREPGEFTFTCRYSPTSLDRAYDLSYTSWGWKVTYPDSSYHGFSGFVTKVEVPSIEPEKVVDFTVTVKVTGAVSYSGGS